MEPVVLTLPSLFHLFVKVSPFCCLLFSILFFSTDSPHFSFPSIARRLRSMDSRMKNEMIEEDEEYDEYGEDYSKKKRALNPGKKASGSGGSTQPCCQVENCSTDMTHSKTYHKRHKVCEFHAKAQVVIIAGAHRRFCQQCSRFHDLSEFDEAKRSCRRRLAGHNERRRKSSYESYAEGSG